MWKIKEFKTYDDMINFMARFDIEKFKIVEQTDTVVVARYYDVVDSIV